MQYLVIFEKTLSGISAYCPDLPGCVAAAETLEECKALITEAIALHIEGLKEDGLEIPQPHSSSYLVTI